ncbi:hypothetical protein WN944_015122 [Citrus x changshan-huyou]|uniref:NmrA-like domain-containing protein n=1 Tax=Citrus x changshan-huyou TaxID=2935761 RepID=A0AAP0M6W1_9ROSI
MPLPPFEAYLEKKRIVRRAIEAAEIPYTFVSANCYGAYFVNVLLRPSEPHDDVVVYGNGEAKGTYTFPMHKSKFQKGSCFRGRTSKRILE